MQQCTPPAVAELGGVPAAAQNVAGPSQHALQPVAAAPLPPLVSTAPSQQDRDTITEVQPNANTKPELFNEASTLNRVPGGLAAESLVQASTNHTDSVERQTALQTTTSATAQDWNYGCETNKSIQGETNRTGATVGAATKGHSSSETTKSEYKQSLPVCPALPGSYQGSNSGWKEPTEMEPPQVASLAQTGQTSLLSQPDGLETTRLQALCQSQPLSSASDGSEIKQTELTELPQTTEDAGAAELDPTGERRGQCEAGDHPSTLRTSGDSTQHMLPGNRKSACYADDNGDEMDGYLPRCPSTLSQEGQVNSDQAKEEALKVLAFSSAAQKPTTPLATLPLKTPERPQELDELQTMTEPAMAHTALSELNQHELSSEILDTSENPNLTTGQTNLSMDVNVEQALQHVPLHGGVCLDASGKEILSSLSAGDSKVLGDETCTETILTVTDGIQTVVTSSTDVILNDSETVSAVLSPNHPQTNSISVTHSETLEALAPQLLSTSQIDNELLTQQMPSPVPTADTFSEMEVCTNTGGIIETQTTEIHTHVLRDLGQVCFLQTDLVSDLSSLPVEILEHEVEEGTWLQVTEPLAEGQVVECGEAQLMDVSDGAHCLETQTIEVSECTVVTYPSDAILSHGQLHLPDSLEEPHVCEATLGSSVELLTEDLGTGPHSPHNGVAGLKAEPEPTVVSYVESTTTGLTPTASLGDSPGQGVDEVPTDTKTDVSQVSQSPGAIDPKLLILKRGETPLLKHPPDLMVAVSKNQSPVSGAQAQVSECLSPSTPAAAAANLDQTPSIPRKLTFSTEEEALSHTDIPSETVDNTQPVKIAADSPPQRPERQPLTGVWGEVCSAISTERGMGSAASLKRPVGEPNKMGQGDGPDPQSPTPRRLDPTAGESSDGEADLSMESHADSSMVTPIQRKVCCKFNLK